MQKNVNLLLLMMAVGAMLIYACTKQDTNANNPQSFKEEAKKYFNDVLLNQDKGIALQESNKFVFDVNVKWDSATVEKAQAFNLVVVPLNFTEFITQSSDGGKIKRPLKAYPFLAFYKTKAGAMMAEVVYKFPSAKSETGKFDGNILVTDWVGTVKRSYVYKNGIPYKTQVSIGQSAAKPEGISCFVTDYYQDTYVGGKYMGTQYLYSKTECTDDAGGRTSGGGGGDPDPGTGQGGPDYGNTGNTPYVGAVSGNVLVNDIKITLKNPCLSQVAFRVLSNKLDNWVATTLDSLGGLGGNYNFYFREDTVGSFPDPTVLGEYRARESTFSGPPSNPKLYGNIVIALNVDSLPGKPIELITLAIYHEIIHGVLAINQVNLNLHHETMANFYRGKLFGALKELFPSMSDRDANALAWLGLYRTFEWADVRLKDFQNYTGISKELSDKAQDYVRGGAGTASGCK